MAETEATAETPAKHPPARKGLEPTLRDFPEMRQLLQEILGDLNPCFQEGIEELAVSLPREAIREACRRAKEEPRLAFDYLRCLSGVDYQEEGREVVYHLYSLRWGHKVTLKVRLSAEDPVVDSVTSVWQGANWPERETAEMFGITFRGHPNPKPLLLVEGLDEHPLLKSSPLIEIEESYDD